MIKRKLNIEKTKWKGMYAEIVKLKIYIVISADLYHPKFPIISYNNRGDNYQIICIYLHVPICLSIK